LWIDEAAQRPQCGRLVKPAFIGRRLFALVTIFTVRCHPASIELNFEAILREHAAYEYEGRFAVEAEYPSPKSRQLRKWKEIARN
jgi:hypothetical protein